MLQSTRWFLLSRWERFSLSQREMAGVRILPNGISRFEPLNRPRYSNVETLRAFLLLPGGEGRDEGERHTIFGFMGREIW
jgi:hypothetical protein